MVSVLIPLNQAVLVQALARDTVLRSWALTFNSHSASLHPVV